jgi:hypothetical protein
MGDHGSMQSGQKSWRDYISTNKLSVEAHTCDFTCAGGIGERNIITDWLREKGKLYLENDLKQKGLEPWCK